MNEELAEKDSEKVLKESEEEEDKEEPVQLEEIVQPSRKTSSKMKIMSPSVISEASEQTDSEA